MTPYEIKLLLHFHCCAGLPEKPPIYAQTVEMFLKLGLVQTARTRDGQPTFITTIKGANYVQRLQQVPVESEMPPPLRPQVAVAQPKPQAKNPWISVDHMYPPIHPEGREAPDITTGYSKEVYIFNRDDGLYSRGVVEYCNGGRYWLSLGNDTHITPTHWLCLDKFTPFIPEGTEFVPHWEGCKVTANLLDMKIENADPGYYYRMAYFQNESKDPQK